MHVSPMSLYTLMDASGHSPDVVLDLILHEVLPNFNQGMLQVITTSFSGVSVVNLCRKEITVIFNQI